MLNLDDFKANENLRQYGDRIHPYGENIAESMIANNKVIIGKRIKFL